MIRAMFGVVRQVSAEECDATGARDLSMPGWVVEAKKQGLGIHTWSTEPDENPQYFCLVGSVLWEADVRESSLASVSESDVAIKTGKVRQKLKDAGIPEEGAFHFVVNHE